MTVPVGWPGIIGIVVLVGGMALAHATPSVSSVAGDPLGGTFFADERGPDMVLNAAGAADNHATLDAALQAIGEDAYGEGGGLIAVYPSTAAAMAAANALLLPPVATSVIQGQLLYVVGLSPDDSLEDHLDGAETFVDEGESTGDGPVVLDLACQAPSREAADELAAELQDYAGGRGHLRPPWIGPELTDDERLARSTYRRWTEAFLAAFQDEAVMARYARELSNATTPEEIERVSELIAAIATEVAPDDLDGPIHEEMMTLLANPPHEGGSAEFTEWETRLAVLQGATEAVDPGQPTWFEQRHEGYIQGVRAVRESVEVGWAVFNRFGLGLTGLLAYLDERGCSDFRIRLSTYADLGM